MKTRQKATTKLKWKTFFPMMGVLLLLGLISACSSVKPPKKIEVWLIEQEEVTLYRELKTGLTQFIPIEDNPDMSKFMCMDKEVFSDYVIYLMEEN